MYRPFPNAVDPDARVEIDRPDEMAAWCRVLGARPVELWQAVRIMGPRVADVQQFLLKERRTDDAYGTE